MNQETQRLYDFIENNKEYKDKILLNKEKYSNFKDFFNQTGYVIMDILSTEKEFFGYPRNKIELDIITERFFV